MDGLCDFCQNELEEGEKVFYDQEGQPICPYCVEKMLEHE